MNEKRKQRRKMNEGEGSTVTLNELKNHMIIKIVLSFKKQGKEDVTVIKLIALES